MILVKPEYTNIWEAIRDIETDHEGFVMALTELASNLNIVVDIPPSMTRTVTGNEDFDPEDINKMFEFVFMNYKWHQYINEAMYIIGANMNPPIIVAPRIYFATNLDEFLILERLMHLDIDSFLQNI